MKKFMKKYLYVAMAFFALMCVGLTACGSDNDDNDGPDDPSNNDSKIVGVWEIVKTTTKYYTTVPEAQDYYNREEVEDGDGSYWEFTSSKLTVHDAKDLADLKPVNYNYNESKGELSITGLLTYKVTKLTKSAMTLVHDSSDGQFGITTTIEFVKKK